MLLCAAPPALLIDMAAHLEIVFYPKIVYNFIYKQGVSYMNQYTIPNLVKAVAILKLLSLHPEGLSAVYIEKQVEVPRTTAFRILKTLLSIGMVKKQGNTYVAGPGLAEIGLNTLNQLQIRQLAVPILQELTEETESTAHLAVPSGDRSLIVEVCDSPHPIRAASRAGAGVSMHCSATGKVFLSYLYADCLVEHLQETSLEARTANTLVNIADIQQMTYEVRKNGYAIDDREYHDDIRCLAAPVFNLNDQVIAAIGIIAPIAHFQKTKIPTVSKAVMGAARRLSSMLGASKS
jgi:DNA-binding IclR family transcriptional regulator